MIYSDEASIEEEVEDKSEAEEEAHEPRKSRWYPDVGKARSPNIAHVKKHVDTKNKKYKPKSSNVKIKSSKPTKLKAPTNHHGKRPKSLIMQKMDNDSRTSSVKSTGSTYKSVEREMEKEQRRLVEERLELEDQRRKFMMGKGQETDRLKETGPVSIDPFADEEFYKPKTYSSGVKIKYNYK